MGPNFYSTYGDNGKWSEKDIFWNGIVKNFLTFGIPMGDIF